MDKRKTSKELITKELTEKDIDKIMELQDEIFVKLENEEILRRNTRETFEECIKAPNVTFGFFDPDFKDKLVGLAILLVRYNEKEDMVSHLVRYKCEKGANSKLVMLKSEYRGNGFQKMVLKMLEERARKLGIDGLCASVSPLNDVSRNNLMACGYEYDHSEVKYEGLERDIFFKEIKQG